MNNFFNKMDPIYGKTLDNLRKVTMTAKKADIILSNVTNILTLCEAINILLSEKENIRSVFNEIHMCKFLKHDVCNLDMYNMGVHIRTKFTQKPKINIDIVEDVLCNLHLIAKHKPIDHVYLIACAYYNEYLRNITTIN